MEMHRRNFLRFSAAVAAMAVAAPAMGEVFKPNKYEEALRLFDLAVDAGQDSTLVSLRIDDLLRFCRDNFEAPPVDEENRRAVGKILHRPTYEGWRDIPPPMVDAIYPIALIKMGLCHYNMPIDTNKMKEFDWFHEAYGQLILRGMDDLSGRG